MKHVGAALSHESARGHVTGEARYVDDLWPKLEGRLKRDSIILLKASRGVQLERLVPHLTTWANA